MYLFQHQHGYGSCFYINLHLPPKEYKNNEKSRQKWQKFGQKWQKSGHK